MIDRGGEWEEKERWRAEEALARRKIRKRWMTGGKRAGRVQAGRLSTGRAEGKSCHNSRLEK